MEKNNVSEKILEKIKKYPELDQQVNDYLKKLDPDLERRLSAEAVKAMEMHGTDKPLEGIFKDNEAPAEVLDVLKKYPEFEKRVDSYLKAVAKENDYHLSDHALEALLDHADIEPVKVEPIPEELTEVIKKYPDVEEELNSYIEDVRKQQELNLSIHALKALEK